MTEKGMLVNNDGFWIGRPSTREFVHEDA
jgi:hypothetical protein